jgi:hypothetical protein
MRNLLMVLAAASLIPAAGQAGNLAESLLTPYESIRSASCEIQRDTRSEGGQVRTLSRVYYQRPDRLRVDNYSPVRRQIVADGTNFYSYIEGDPKGFCRAVTNLDGEMSLQLRKIPGTAADHLSRLRGLSEISLPPADGFPVRAAYDAGKVFVVLSADPTGRLARIEFFASSDMSRKTGQYDYSGYTNFAGGVWIPCVHRGRFWVGGVESEETVRVGSLAVNEPIAPGLFSVGIFFKGVEFVPAFEEVYR